MSFKLTLQTAYLLAWSELCVSVCVHNVLVVVSWSCPFCFSSFLSFPIYPSSLWSCQAEDDLVLLAAIPLAVLDSTLCWWISCIASLFLSFTPLELAPVLNGYAMLLLYASFMVLFVLLSLFHFAIALLFQTQAYCKCIKGD